MAKNNKIKLNIKQIQTRPQTVLSEGQAMLREIFNGEPTFGTGQNLPVLHRTLTTGGGLIKNGDYQRETAGLFGFRKRRLF